MAKKIDNSSIKRNAPKPKDIDNSMKTTTAGRKAPSARGGYKRGK